MRPQIWRPPVELSPAEADVVRVVRRGQLFVFLRQWRHELFDDAFQNELNDLYVEAEKGHPPVAPAQLALVTILQAYTGVSDAEAIEALAMDRRWQLVLGCLGATRAPFGKGTLWRFRSLLIARDMDRRLVERTVEMARQRGGFGARALRAALDASPLWGAGRVEDTYNLLGHALHKALSVLARQQGRGLADVAREAGAPELALSSLKAALDIDWDDPVGRVEALGRVLTLVTAVTAYVADQASVPAATHAALATAEQARKQDVAQTDDGTPVLAQGVARDRRISVEDEQMRHGRKSRTHRFDGYKRHIVRDLDSGLIHAVAMTAANAPEASATDALVADLDHQDCAIAQLHIDRGYLSSSLVRDRPADRVIVGKAWPIHNGDRFPKTAFTLDWDRQTIRCPAHHIQPFIVGSTVHFPTAVCASCGLRPHCTRSPQGRSIAIHRDEQLLGELRAQQRTPEGRALLRERIAVEHDLAHISQWQGHRARYRGIRKNLFDLRRIAVVSNLHLIKRRYPPRIAA